MIFNVPNLEKAFWSPFLFTEIWAFLCYRFGILLKVVDRTDGCFSGIRVVDVLLK